jgi:iron complex outermembrane receptor protein
MTFPRSVAPVVALLAAICVPGALAGQETATAVPPADELVFGAARYAQHLSEAPASVTIVTRAEIRRFGWRTLGEALAATAGVYSIDDRNYSYLQVRGLGGIGDFNTRVLFLVDGARINDEAQDGVGLGTESLLDLDAIERIEVIRGPASSLFGTSAFYGVINLITRRGADAKGAGARVEAGSFGTRRGAVAYGVRTAGGTDAFLMASGLHADGQDYFYPAFDAPATNNGNSTGSDDDKASHLFGRWAKGDFTATGAYVTRTKQVPTASYETDFNDGREQTKDWVGLASLNYEHAFEDLSRLFTTVAYNRTGYQGAYPYGGLLTRDYVYSESVSLTGQYFRFFGNGHRLWVGGELRRRMQGDLGAYETGGAGTLTRVRTDSWVSAIFAQGEFHVAPRAQLTAGVRYDHFASFGGTVNPRAALVYSLGPLSSLKAIYGRAFRAPNTYEQFYSDGDVTQKMAGSLDPERIGTAELALERRFSSRVRGRASLYRVDVTGLIALVTDPADSLLVFENRSKTSSTGVEAELSASLPRGVELRAAFAVQDPKDEDLDVTPAGAPRTLGRLGVTFPVVSGVARVAVEARYAGARPIRSGGEAPAVTVAGLSLFVHPLGEAGPELMGTVYNLFDTQWGEPGGEEHLQATLPQDGRSFRFGLRYGL